MKNNEERLRRFRLTSAELSEGISSQPVRELVIRLLTQLPKASLLDFGAGKGELLHYLNRDRKFTRLCGADITDRPESLPQNVEWMKTDLNDPFETKMQFELVIAVEVIEHLENPRAVMRKIATLMTPGGYCVITTPNQESLRSIASLVLNGHYAAFRGKSYPAHITALLSLDMQRIAMECGLVDVQLHYTDHGSIPKACYLSWQQVSFSFLKGKRFSDNFAIIARKPLSI